MLEFLNLSYQRLSARKLRLFAVYCFRNIVHSENELEVRHAVDLGEQFADGIITDSEFYSTHEPVNRVWLRDFGSDRVSAAVWCLTHDAISDPFIAAGGACANGIDAAQYRAGTGSSVAEAALQAAWLRDIFPSPFRPKYVTRNWFLWNGGSATILARQMYESRDFSAMPILADALQDAGCDNDDILNHCRNANGVHVRGCWVVDLLLDKK
jgi:hypothetical protein